MRQWPAQIPTTGGNTPNCPSAGAHRYEQVVRTRGPGAATRAYIVCTASSPGGRSEWQQRQPALLRGRQANGTALSAMPFWILRY